MNLYETTFIINPQTDDATIDRHVRQVADLITNNQGKIRYEDHMGTRRLAYEIDGLTQGYYASFIFEAPTAVLPVLDRHFKLNEAYIRNLTVRYEGDLDRLLKREGRSEQKPAEKPSQTPTPAEKPAAEKAPEAETEKKEEAPAETESAESSPEEPTESKTEEQQPEQSEERKEDQEL